MGKYYFYKMYALNKSVKATTPSAEEQTEWVTASSSWTL